MFSSETRTFFFVFFFLFVNTWANKSFVTLSWRNCSLSPDKEAQLTHMQEKQQFYSFRSTEQNYVPGGRLRLKVLQSAIILQPEPAEELNDDGWYEHEAHKQPAPYELSMRVELLCHPQIRAHVKQKRAHADEREEKIQQGVLGERRAVHHGMSFNAEAADWSSATACM